MMALLGWAFVALIASIVAAVFGFTKIAAGAATVAKVLFGVFAVVFLVLLIIALLAQRAAAQSSGNFNLITDESHRERDLARSGHVLLHDGGGGNQVSIATP